MKERGNVERKTIFNKKGQVWVETVVYLLIAFSMMGLVLAFIKPKIEEMRDKTLLDDSLEVIKEIDNSITTIGTPGNRRLLEVGVKKGSFIIDSENDVIRFEMESNHVYTEIGSEVSIGKIKAITEENGRGNKITLTRDFSEEYDFTYGNQQTTKILTKAPTAYRLFITNRGELSGRVLIDFSIE